MVDTTATHMVPMVLMALMAMDIPMESTGKWYVFFMFILNLWHP